jgi:hypothetical protein
VTTAATGTVSAMPEPSNPSDQQIKHLELIQAVVSRLGNNGFLIKGWSVTIAGAFLAFGVNSDKWQLAAAGLAPTLLFWILDASFLRNERLFRHLFDAARRGEVEIFFMGATGPTYVENVEREFVEGRTQENPASRWATFGRETLWLFYGAIILGTVIVAVLIHCT